MLAFCLWENFFMTIKQFMCSLGFVVLIGWGINSFAATQPAAATSQKAADNTLQAQTTTPLQYYVSASPKAAVRMDPKPSSTILRYIILGTPVRILQKDSGGAYVLVQTEDGDQGWIASHNITHIADNAKQNILSKVGTAIDHQVDALKPVANKVGEKLKAVGNNLTDWQVESGSDARKATAYTQKMEMQLQNLKQENAVLAANNSRAWFVVGAAVFFVGLLIGMMLGRMMKKRTQWG